MAVHGALWWGSAVDYLVDALLLCAQYVATGSSTEGEALPAAGTPIRDRGGAVLRPLEVECTTCHQPFYVLPRACGCGCRSDDEPDGWGYGLCYGLYHRHPRLDLPLSTLPSAAVRCP